MKRIILVDDISSISESIFSFKYKGKIIKKDPFVLKSKQELNGIRTYHLDSNDLQKISQINTKLKPYDWMEDLNKRDFIHYMKVQFYDLIIKGEMIGLLSYLYGKRLSEYEIKWPEHIPPRFKI